MLSEFVQTKVIPLLDEKDSHTEKPVEPNSAEFRGSQEMILSHRGYSGGGGEVATLLDKIKSLESDVQHKQTDLERLEAEAEEKKGYIQSLEENMNQLVSEIKSLNETISKLTGDVAWLDNTE